MRLIEQFDTGRGTYRSALYRPYQAGTFRTSITSAGNASLPGLG